MGLLITNLNISVNKFILLLQTLLNTENSRPTNAIKLKYQNNTFLAFSKANSVIVKIKSSFEMI